MKYIRIDQVRNRYGGCSARTIDRNVQLGLIAPPQYLNGRKFWSVEKLDEYDASGPQGSPPAPHSSGGRGRPRARKPRVTLSSTIRPHLPAHDEALEHQRRNEETKS